MGSVLSLQRVEMTWAGVIRAWPFKHVPEAAMAGMDGWRGESWLAERVVAEVAGISNSVS